MSLDIVGFRESSHLRVGYGAFAVFRRELLSAAPLDFQLQYQLWWESVWDDHVMRPGPYMEYTEFPDWDRTPMRAVLWAFFAHSDCDGDWEDPHGVAALLRVLRDRLPDRSRIDRNLLDNMIERFANSDEVRFR